MFLRLYRLNAFPDKAALILELVTKSTYYRYVLNYCSHQAVFLLHLLIYEVFGSKYDSKGLWQGNT